MKKIQIFRVGDVCENGIYSCANCGQKTYVSNKILTSNCTKCGFNSFTFLRPI